MLIATHRQQSLRRAKYSATLNVSLNSGGDVTAGIGCGKQEVLLQTARRSAYCADSLRLAAFTFRPTASKLEDILNGKTVKVQRFDGGHNEKQL